MFLITTADRRSYNKNFKNLIFLGPGCIEGYKFYASKNIKYKINSHLWLNPYKMHKDSIEIEIIYEILLNQLKFQLNELHKISWSKEQWKILIGPWLHKLSYIIYERWFSIDKVYRENKITNTSIYFTDPSNLYTNSREDLSEKTKDHIWNKILFDNIIKFKKKKFYISDNSDYKNLKFYNTKKINLSFKKFFKNIIYNPFLVNFLRFLKRNDNITFVNPYISDINVIRLKFKYKNLPIPDYTLKYNFNADKIDKKIRSKINLDFSQNDNEILLFFAKVIPYCIPSIYVENFNKLKILSEKSALPHNPKIIFSGVAHWHDEVFKYWPAKKIVDNSFLYIIQHGGEYGSPLYNCGEVHELQIASKFLSWGWYKEKDFKSISIPFINNSKINNWSEKGDLMIVLASLKLSPYLSDMCTNSLFGEKCEIYSESIVKFLSKLPQLNHIRYKLRFFPESTKEKELSKRISNLAIKRNIKISEENTFLEALKKSTICIFTYEGTPFSESMARNIPSLLLISQDLNPIRKKYYKIFMELEKAKILHWDEKSLYKHLEIINGNINAWWNSKLVKKGRMSYCEVFGNNKASIYKELKVIIEEKMI